LRNLKIYCHVHNGSLLAPIPSQINPIRAFTAHFLKVCRVIILTSMPRFSKCPLSFNFPHETPVRTFLFLLPPPSRGVRYAAHTPHSSYGIHLRTSSRNYYMQGETVRHPMRYSICTPVRVAPPNKADGHIHIYIHTTTDELHSWLPCWRSVLCRIRTSHLTNHRLP